MFSSATRTSKSVGDNGALMTYVAKYTAKFSDSLQEELQNDDLDGNSLAVGVLSRYKPMEPEMVLQMFGSRYRQWHISTKGGGKRSFLVPVPDAEALPEEVLQYEHCEWKGPKTSLLDFLRKTTGDGKVCHWLEKLYKDHVRAVHVSYANVSVCSTCLIMAGL